MTLKDRIDRVMRYMLSPPPIYEEENRDALEQEFAAVVSEERERCAKIAEDEVERIRENYCPGGVCSGYGSEKIATAASIALKIRGA